MEELKKFLLRGSEEQPAGTPFQRIWRVLFPLLLFWMVRNLGQQAALTAFAAAGSVLKGGAFWFVREESGMLTGLTGNAGTVAAVIGFLAGAAVIWKTALRQLEITADDMRLLHLKQEPKGNFLLLGTLTVGSVMGLNLLMELSGFVRFSETYQAVSQDQYSAAPALGLAAYGLVTPIAEELLFRGVIYGRLRRMLKIRPAMLLSAVFFGMYHMNSVQGIYGFLMGCVIVYAYEYFGDFKAALAVHMIANLLAYSISYTPLAAAGLSGWPACVGFLALAAGSFWLLSRKRHI